MRIRSDRREWLGVLLATGLFLAYCSLSNIAISESFREMPLRETDELAFQQVLQALAGNISRRDYAGLVEANSYAYGWFYWVLNAVAVAIPRSLEVPGMSGDVGERFVILVPRFMAMGFEALAIIVWTRILRLVQPRSGALVLTAQALVLASLPVVIYGATKFHPTSLVNLLTALALLFACRALLRRRALRSWDLALAGLFIGLAAGTKLSALVVIPGLALILMFRLFQVRDLRGILLPSALAILGFLASASPLLGLRLLRGESSPYVDAVRGQLLLQQHADGRLPPWDNALEAVAGWSFAAPVALALLIMVLGAAFVSRLFTSSAQRICYLGLVVNLLIGMTYLAVTVGQGSGYVALYAIPVTFVLVYPLSLATRVRVSSRIRAAITVGSCCLMVLPGISVAWVLGPGSAEGGLETLRVRPSNYFLLREHERAFADEKREQEEIARTMGINDLRGVAGSVLADYRVSLPVNSVSDGAVISYTFDNAGLRMGEVNSGAFAWVFLSRKSVATSTALATGDCELLASYPSLRRECEAIRDFSRRHPRYELRFDNGTTLGYQLKQGG